MYGNALKTAFNKEWGWSTTVKVLLTTSSYTPNKDTHDYKNDVTNEVANGGGYTTGGAAIASPTLTFTAANSWGTAWAASTAYAVGAIIRPSSGNGHLYRCVTAGTSGASEPTWPTASGKDVTDNTAVWTEIGTSILVLDCADPSWSSSTITARHAVFYYDTGTASTSPLIGYLDFGEDRISNNGPFTITIDANGAFQHFPAAA